MTHEQPQRLRNDTMEKVMKEIIRYAEEAIVSLADFENITVWSETLHTGLFA
ncbi:MAG: hypothetical protein LUO95_06075 [Methylococcaceae bacterium]|nr:hypothetical protein [Methylococcaceae bacterium]MDD1610168.1 hypothetical protein [Methylococcaceae bacterium]MDD1615414.1 hypothetical protein [Methylococcaceae bacterium]OYV20367.1 MAG: hypothetical protein CG439_496 [Methylococcaceae bacterium NSP1-2]